MAILLSSIAILVVFAYSANASELKHVVACDGDYFNLQCPADRKIKIVDAVLGRNDFDQAHIANCPYYPATCFGIDTYDRMRKRCEHEQYCTGTVDRYTFGELFCNYYTSMYLKVAFLCKAPYEMTICEGSWKQLRCNQGKKIQILKAIYGTNEPDEKNSCPHVVTPQEEHNEPACAQDVTYHAQVGGQCNGQLACSVDASNTHFGDPCPGWAKSLRVEWKCVH